MRILPLDDYLDGFFSRVPKVRHLGHAIGFAQGVGTDRLRVVMAVAALEMSAGLLSVDQVVQCLFDGIAEFFGGGGVPVGHVGENRQRSHGGLGALPGAVCVLILLEPAQGT